MSFFCLFLEMFFFSYCCKNSVLFSSNPNNLFPSELLLFTDMCLLELFVDKFSFSLLKYQLL